MKLISLFENQEYQAFQNYILKKYEGLKAFHIIEWNDDIELNSIIVEKDRQKEGIGGKVMEELVKFADHKRKRIILHVGLNDKVHGTTSRSRLVKFYKRFGFVENKNRNKDFTITHGMYRNPK